MKTTREDRIILAIEEIMSALNLVLVTTMDDYPATRDVAIAQLNKSRAHITSCHLEKLDGEPIPLREEGISDGLLRA